MKKKMLKRGLLGLPIGIAIGHIITLSPQINHPSKTTGNFSPVGLSYSHGREETG